MRVQPDTLAVRHYFEELQQRIVARFEMLDASAKFVGDAMENPGGGMSRPRVLEGGRLFEKAAVMFTHSRGAALPAAATERNPDLAGRAFEAVAISLITHPSNPHVPTTHMNLRFFLVHDAHSPVWYFGGGFDLTPVYATEEDCRHWHATALAACADFGADVYPMVKEACDRYFYLPHRQQCRGIGGIFFDDWTRGGFDTSLAYVRSVGDAFLPAYVPIVERRQQTPFTDAERAFQLYRRGRYAEFNLAVDRGTRYGMQSGRRIESVLASLPPLAAWRYDWHPPAGSREAALDAFLTPRNWVGRGEESGG